MKVDCANGHLFGPTQTCLMCGEPNICKKCGEKHGTLKGFRREAIGFLTVLREVRGLGMLSLAKEHLVGVITEMTLAMVDGGPEVPPDEVQISCYVEEFIKNARKLRVVKDTNDTSGSDSPSAS